MRQATKPEASPGVIHDELLRELEAAARTPRPGLAPRALWLTVLLMAVVWGLAEARPFLVPLSLAALLAFLLAPFVRLLRRARTPEWLAITLSAILLLLPLMGLGYLIINQVQALSRDSPRIAASLNHLITDLSQTWLGRKLELADHIDFNGLTRRFASSAGEGLQLLLSGLGALLSAGSQAALVGLFTILMLASRRHLRLTGERLLARNRNIEAAEMLDEVTFLVERFLIARFLIVLIIGAVDYGILRLFGLNYAVFLGTFLGVMTLVPAIGFILAVIPPITVSLAMGHSALGTLALVGALFFMSVIEGNVLTPKMVGKSLNINALCTFVGLFAGSLLWGIWGMVLSIPLLGIMRISLSTSPRLQPWADFLADKPAEPLHIRFSRSRGGNA